MKLILFILFIVLDIILTLGNIAGHTSNALVFWAAITVPILIGAFLLGAHLIEEVLIRYKRQ